MGWVAGSSFRFEVLGLFVVSGVFWFVVVFIFLGFVGFGLVFF